MSIYNLIEYSSNYSETTGSLWLYSKNEASDFNNNIADTDKFQKMQQLLYHQSIFGIFGNHMKCS